MCGHSREMFIKILSLKVTPLTGHSVQQYVGGHFIESKDGEDLSQRSLFFLFQGNPLRDLILDKKA